jgi:teichuronic acid biosynthesis glycosyltransferase TuaC
MRIALVTTSYPAFPGDPSGHFVESEARRLAHEADVLVVTTGASRSPKAAAVTVWHGGGRSAFGWPGVAARLRENPLRLASAACWVTRARAFLRSQPRFDRIVAHWAVPSAFPVALGLDVPLEVVSHGGDVRLLTRLPAPARTAVLDRILRDACRWRFVSGALHDELAATLTSRDRRRLAAIASVAAPAIDLPDVAAHIAQRRNARGQGRLVVCVGRLVASKRFARALDHLAEEGRAGRNASVVVVGDGPDRTRLERQARALGLDARFVGRATREDALAWIGASDGLLHASHAEGLSTVVREAEALGVPVVYVA